MPERTAGRARWIRVLPVQGMKILCLSASGAFSVFQLLVHKYFAFAVGDLPNGVSECVDALGRRDTRIVSGNTGLIGYQQS